MASGLHDAVLVLGVEKMTSQPTPKVTEILAAAGDVGTEGRAGATFPALFAMIARRHMYQYGTTREMLAAVAVKNHANGAKNPQAHMRKVITMEQAMNGKPIADPLTVYDCSLISDGAAAVLIVAAERASEFTDKPVRVLGIAQTSDYLALDEKPDITTLSALKTSSDKAYKMAGVTPAGYSVRRSSRLLHHSRNPRARRLGLRQKRRRWSVHVGGAHMHQRRAAHQHQRRFEGQGTSGGRDRRGPDLRCDDSDSRRGGRETG